MNHQVLFSVKNNETVSTDVVCCSGDWRSYVTNIYTICSKAVLLFCCCFVVLHPRLTSEVMSGRSVNLTTLFLRRLRPSKRLTSFFAHTFASN